MDAAALRGHCLGLLGAAEEFPFGPETSVFKVGGKIFALAAGDADPPTVSVKCEPELAAQLRADYDAIVPGYHLNKRHWLTITLGGDAADELVLSLIEDSYALVAPKRLPPEPDDSQAVSPPARRR